MAETKWTPGKLEVASNEVELLDEKGHLIARVMGYMSGLPSEANTRRLVQCWNNHDALVEALEAALPRLAHKRECGISLPASEWKEKGSWSYENCCCEIRQVKAVLAAARGEQVEKGEK